MVVLVSKMLPNWCVGKRTAHERHLSGVGSEGYENGPIN